jgi:uncharacterized membrane protein
MSKVTDGVLHFLLKFRILQVTVTVYLCMVLWVFVKWMTATPYADLAEWQLATVVVSVPALITGLFATLKTAIKPEE